MDKVVMQNVKAIYEVYNDGIIDKIIWVRRKFNLVDEMTRL